MIRYFDHYSNREDYKSGLYAIRKQLPNMIVGSAKILSSKRLTKKYMSLVIKSRPIATKINLTNTSKNRIAWLGQSCCNIAIGATEDEVKTAWKSMPEKAQTDANRIAYLLINMWENENTH